MTSPSTGRDCCTANGLEDLEEFDDAHTLTRTYCKQVSEDQFEDQAVAETEKALTDLMKYIDCNKDEFTDFLRKKKKQDLENGGIFSFVKVKVFDMIHGENSPLVRVSDKEREKKLEKMKKNMQKALDYTIETKGRRYSTRLQEKRKGVSQTDLTVKPSCNKKAKGSSGSLSVQGPPPPPPPPPLLPESMPPPPPPPPPFVDSTPKFCRNSLARKPLMPIESRMNGQLTPRSSQKGGSHDLNDSLGSIPSLNCSLTSLHQELISSNPWKRLKCVDENKSPGGTPGPAKKSLQMGTPSLSHQPLYQALFTNIQEKFRNARSPSPSPHDLSQNASYIASPQGFTP